jgi:hypothetical protein
VINAISGVGLVYGELEFSQMKTKCFAEWMGENGYLQDYSMINYPAGTCEFNASFMDLVEEIGQGEMTLLQVMYNNELHDKVGR